MKKTVYDIVKEYLEEHGYEGLCNANGECACELSDFEPCGDMKSDCEPGFKAPCDCGDHDFHIISWKCDDDE